jgi:hypothetical protein
MTIRNLHRVVAVLVVLVGGACADKPPVTCGPFGEEAIRKCEEECNDAKHPLASSCEEAGTYWGLAYPILNDDEATASGSTRTAPPRDLSRALALWERGCRLGSTEACWYRDNHAQTPRAPAAPGHR